MVCPNCKAKVSVKDSICPSCSFPLPKMGEVSVPQGANDQQKNNFVDEKFDYKNIVSNTNGSENTSNQVVSENKKKKVKASKKPKVPKENKEQNNILSIILIGVILGLLCFIVLNKMKYKAEKARRIVAESKIEEINSKDNKTDENTENNTSSDDNKGYTLTDQESYSLGKQLWTLALDTVWCKSFVYGDKLETLGDGKKGYEIINYKDVADNFTGDFTYEYNNQKFKFNDLFNNLEKDGKHYDLNKCTNRTENKKYLDTDFVTKDKTENKIVYNVTSKFCDKNWNGECTNPDKVDEIEKEFIIIKDNNIWKIQYFYIPN